MKIGLIGCGKQAPKHLSGLRAAGAEVVLCDVDAERARRLAAQHGLDWTADSATLFADRDVVAVDIATPTTTHAGLIEQAIAGGKHFFCEKPLCETLAQARALELAASRAEVIGMVGYLYRYAPVFEIGRGLHRRADGTDGPLGRAVSACFRIGGRGEHELWKHRRASGGGAISEMLVHMLDLAIWYFGEVREAVLLGDELLRPRRRIGGQDVEVDAEDFVLARLALTDCAHVLVQADLVTPVFNQYVEIQYEGGSFMGSIQAELPSFVYASSASGPYQAGRTALADGGTNLFERQMAAFLNQVATRAAPERNSIHDSILVMEALNMLRNTRAGR